MEKPAGWWAGRSSGCCIMLERLIIISMVRCSSSVDHSCETFLRLGQTSKPKSQRNKNRASIVYLHVAHGFGCEQACNLGSCLSSKKLNTELGNVTQTGICLCFSPTGFLDKNNDLLNRNLIEVSFSQPEAALCWGQSLDQKKTCLWLCFVVWSLLRSCASLTTWSWSSASAERKLSTRNVQRWWAITFTLCPSFHSSLEPTSCGGSVLKHVINQKKLLVLSLNVS